jgi:hypothetical protein
MTSSAIPVYLPRPPTFDGPPTSTAGNWSTPPTVIQLFGPGVKKPGDIVQSLYMESTAQTQNSSATPVNTQATLSITPTSAANVVRATSTGTLYSDTAGAGALA